jgi:addiction module RelE/StbE family toxin
VTKYLYSPRFVKQFKKLPSPIQRLTLKKLKVFEANPFHPNLKTHKLTGKLKPYFSFSINYSYRIIFEIESPKQINILLIGTHEIYK